jgi:transposase
LADFAQHFKLGKNKQVVLALDRAGWHTTGKLEVAKGIHLIEMPSHSPELQPAERLWPLTNESLANRTFENLDELEELGRVPFGILPTVRRCGFQIGWFDPFSGWGRLR